MARQNTKQINEAIEQMLSIAKQATKEIAEEVAIQMEIAYERTIEEFYNDYKQPRYYKRTNATYYGSNGFGDMAIWKNCIEKNKKGYLAGIYVHDTYIKEASIPGVKGNPYRAHTDWVFERTFVQGIHGMTPQEVSEASWLKPDGATPFYRYPIIRGKRPWQKSPMRPTPEERMDKRRREIYDRLDKMTKEKMDEAFGRYSR